MSSEFLSDLFGDQEGYVYSPIKADPKNPKSWEQYFFNWPQERTLLEEHIGDFNRREVYISPVMFTDPRISPETFKGTCVVWTEFDGTLPNKAIEPTMRIMSSQEGHEHWYWRLDHFETDKTIIEDITRRIAFHYGADLSAWDYQQVLRPVDTWNHKRNKPVTLLSKNNILYSINDFLGIPIPPAGTRVDIHEGRLPGKEEVLAKYRWTVDALDLLFKDEIPKGRRSDALARLAHEVIESGCSNEEAFVLLLSKDDVWGKFVGRSDRKRRIESLIANVRRRKATVAEIVHGAPEVYRFSDFMNTNIELKWAIEGLLPVAGSMVIFGKPGIGKSTFSLRLAIHLALGKDKFLLWNIINRQRVLFVSLEMQHYEVKEFFRDMQIPEDEERELQEQFFIWPIGNPYPFDTPDQQLELVKYIKLHKIELVIIDSLSISMYGSVKDDDAIKRLNSFLNEDVRRDLKCSYIFIHHPRKKGIGETESKDDLDDGYGSTYINANAQTVVVLSSRPGSNRIKVKLPKTRMVRKMEDFEIERTPNRGFILVGSNQAAYIKETMDTTISEPGESPPDEIPTNNSLGKLFNF